MKNSNEWIDDIERKLNERYIQRNKRRKIAIKYISSLASCSLILIAAFALSNNTIPDFYEQIIDSSVTEETTQRKENTTFNQSTECNDSSSSIEVTTKRNDNNSLNITTENSNNSINKTTCISEISESDNNNDILETYPDDVTSSATLPLHDSDHENTYTTIKPNTQPITKPITKPVTQPSENIEQPTQTTVVEPTSPNEFDFRINEIISITQGVVTSDSIAYEKVIWSYQQMVDYYGIDFRDLQSSVFSDSDYSADIHDEYTVSIRSDGSLETDCLIVGYHDSCGKYIKISASKVTVPYDCIYKLESKEASYIDGISTIIGGMSKSENNDFNFFYADFQKNDVNYRLIGEDISQEEFCRILSEFIKM